MGVSASRPVITSRINASFSPRELWLCLTPRSLEIRLSCCLPHAASHPTVGYRPPIYRSGEAHDPGLGTDFLIWPAAAPAPLKSPGRAPTHAGHAGEGGRVPVSRKERETETETQQDRKRKKRRKQAETTGWRAQSEESTGTSNVSWLTGQQLFTPAGHRRLFVRGLVPGEDLQEGLYYHWGWFWWLGEQDGKGRSWDFTALESFE